MAICHTYKKGYFCLDFGVHFNHEVKTLPFDGFYGDKVGFYVGGKQKITFDDFIIKGTPKTKPLKKYELKTTNDFLKLKPNSPFILVSPKGNYKVEVSPGSDTLKLYKKSQNFKSVWQLTSTYKTLHRQAFVSGLSYYASSDKLAAHTEFSQNESFLSFPKGTFNSIESLIIVDLITPKAIQEIPLPIYTFEVLKFSYDGKTLAISVKSHGFGKRVFGKSYKNMVIIYSYRGMKFVKSQTLTGLSYEAGFGGEYRLEFNKRGDFLVESHNDDEKIWYLNGENFEHIPEIDKHFQIRSAGVSFGSDVGIGRQIKNTSHLNIDTEKTVKNFFENCVLSYFGQGIASSVTKNRTKVEQVLASNLTSYATAGKVTLGNFGKSILWAIFGKSNAGRYVVNLIEIYQALTCLKDNIEYTAPD